MGRNETANFTLSLSKIKRFTLSKTTTLYDEIYIGHTPCSALANRTCTKYWKYRYRSGFKGPLSILDVDTKRVLAERALSLCILTKKEEIKI
jgi:hypothetical protein